MANLPYLLTILLVFETANKVNGQDCVLSFPEASVGTVFTGGNLTKILNPVCSGKISLTETNPSNPFFNLTSSTIMMAKSTRLESEKDRDVGRSQCAGIKLNKTIPELNFKCSDTGETYPTGSGNPFYSGNRCDKDYNSDSSDSINIIDKNGLIGMNHKISKFNLWLKHKLDYKKTQEYSFEMNITSEIHGSITETIVIHVEDADDQSPVFDEKIYTCNITEGHYGRTNGSVCKVKAYDPDFGINATLKYQLISYVPNDPNINFSISADDGTIRVNGSIDRESIAEYALSVLAYQVNDKLNRNNLTTVVIRVTDIDDNPPKFVADTVTIEIMENTNNDVVVYTPSVVDKDQDENARCHFSLKDNSVFRINQTTGVVSVKDSSFLDRETHPGPFMMQITVSSLSNPTFKDTMILRASLLDVNDNSPQFTNNSPYVLTMKRNSLVGKEICCVNASDADTGLNGNVTYSLTSHVTPFAIDSTTGAIKLRQSLNDTNIRHYEFYVMAADNPVDHSMTRSSWTKVSIEITDENTHKPSFDIVWKIDEITENGDDHVMVAILNCTDLDWSDTLNVLISHGSNGKFSVSKMNGTLYKLETTKPLDREDTSSYTIQMICSDGSNKQVLNIPVDVLDQNDNRPQFKVRSPVKLNVPENQAKKFTQFVATDLDSGKNQKIVYSILPNPVLGGKITINKNTGELSIHALDRESLVSDTIDITIVAADLGSPSLTSTLNVKVTIIDVNDNPPVFTQFTGHHDVFVKEGQKLTDNTCMATDTDDGLNKKILYKTTQLLPIFDHVVKVDQNGSVTFDLTNFDVDEFIKNASLAFDVTIAAYNPTAYSNGHENATCVITLHMIDINDNKPTFAQHHYYFTINETALVGSSIGSVSATDKDHSPEYSLVRYTMDNSTALFRIDKLTGEIFLNKGVDYDTELKHTYTFKVYATDTDDPVTKPNNVNGTTTVTITVRPENDNPPKFKQENTFCKLHENHTGDFNCSVTATDADHDFITYNMESERKSFTIDSSGFLNCKKGFDFETSREHIMFLNISATDKLFTTYTTVVVELINTDDEAPRFTNDNYTFEIYENNLNNQFIGVFGVTDADSTSISYTLDKNSDFQISSAGELQARKSFDRETQDMYNLLVTASDGLNKRNVTATVKILDRNDNPPTFPKTSEIIPIQENGPATIKTFIAHDRDKGRNGNVSFSLVISDFWRKNVTIDGSGRVTIKSLDREALKDGTLDFTITAVDQGTPSLTGSMNVKVTVSDKNDNAPVFTRCFDEQTLYLTEGEIYPDFLHLQASDIDEGNNGKVKYKLHPLPDKLKSAIRVSDNGRVNFDLRNVDVDVRSFTHVDWNITVEAYNPTRYIHGIEKATCVIKLHIMDKNDNLPKFNQRNYSFNVSETATSGTIVGSVTATDKDRSPEYSIVKYIMDNSTDVFRIDKLTGEIFLNKGLDYDTELKHDFTFKVYATDVDHAFTSNQYDTALVTVRIQQENDNAPEFNQGPQTCSLPENNKGPLNCTIVATDRDKDSITYNIQPADLLFRRRASGTLISDKQFDYETSPHQFSLNVTASDGIHYASTIVTIELLNLNDEVPHFSRNSYKFELYENNLMNQLIGTLHVIDLDGPNITFTVDNANNFFISQNGELRAKQTFDREMHNSYDFTVTAFDGAHKNSTTVHVTILDRNDNVPTFNITGGKLELVIPENRVRTFGPYEAYDRDEGKNGYVSYSVIIHDLWRENVTINNKGQVTVKLLDREALEDGTLDFTIMATDQGSPSLTGTLNVKVTVGDENDNPPVFTNCFDDQNVYLYEGEVYRNYSCEALDSDEGNNSVIKYWIDAVSGFPGYVRINPSRGNIYLNLKNVDADTGTGVWIITVTAYNRYNAVGVQNATRSFQLHILDINDNSPIFGQKAYSFSFNESTAPGVSIGSVLAKDKDRSTEFNTVKYIMDNSTLFRVDRTTGVIYLIKEIDYDTQNHSYNLQIKASDGLNSDTADVSITVTGVNDIAPKFTQDFFRCQLRENSVGKFSCHVKAVDLDVDDTSTLKYMIGGEDMDFTIDTDGNLRCNIKYDYDDVSQNHTFFLNVSVTDGIYSGFITVAVELININDEAPVFSQPNYTFYIEENNRKGSVVGSVHVFDADTENVSLTIDKIADFEITKEGNLRARREFDAERDGNFTLTVSASDSVQTKSSTITVVILDLNDNAPVFHSSIFGQVFNIRESEHVGYLIANIAADDHDRDEQNNQVEYILLDGNINSSFMLNTASGKLTLHSSLNASLIQQFDLVIQAKDNGTPSLSYITTITVKIMDENNNPPYFMYVPYEGSVMENTNNLILRVHAADPDIDANLTFTVITDKKGLCNLTFVGDKLYASHLDAEVIGKETITCDIKVTDGKHSVKTSVVVHVVDVNDNSPVFDNTAKYTVYNVTDTLSAGSRVTKISATDADFSTRQESILYFLQGDTVGANYFGIDYLTGDITVQQSLGPVSGSTINVSITARDAGIPPRNTSRIVSVHVKEVNLHPPEFHKTPVYLQVKENGHVLSEFINATDTDGDTISYRILPGRDASLFHIDESTGLFGLSNKSFTFDYETKSQYSLIIQATDNARFPKSANVTVIVEVIDVNEKPTIEVPNSRVYKKINTTVGDIITTVRVTDPDTKNETFREHIFIIKSILISTRKEVSFFSVNDNGTIRVNNTLTQPGMFTLNVTVINLDLTVNGLTIEVIVSNVTGTSKNIYIDENNIIPYPLSSLEGNFNYRIASSTRGNFSIIPNGTHFQLVTYTVFDYDEMEPKTIDFSIEGVNTRTKILEKQIQVHITVNNLNDNTPEFNATHYEIVMYENQTVGEAVGMVTATDKDGDLAQLTYSMKSINKFRIDNNSGTITLAESWDFEKSSVHSLHFDVTCSDTKYTSSTTVTMLLMDVNDNSPVFTQNMYTFSVYENLTVGMKIPNMTVFGSDKDTMDQGKLSYHILPGKNGGKYFDLDVDRSGNSSSFILSKALDYEQMKTLEFDVMVIDTDQHNSTVTVTVHILDVNDNDPVFNQSSYNFTVKEGLTYVGSTFEISAFDRDTGENGQVNLTLQGNHNKAIHLAPKRGGKSSDTRTGILNIIPPLDRENPNVPHENGTAIYEVTVLATDNGDPKRTSSVLVSVYVEDVNDCPPEFSQSNYSISIQEGVTIGQQVAMFTTSDCDYNPAFTQASFTLTGDGSESFKFENASEHTGALFVAKELDWHVKQFYTLIVTAFDGKNTRNASLFITVLDTNDNAPHFNQTEYTFNVTENQTSGINVGSVSATDEDVGLNGNVTYSITSGNVNHTFQIITDFNDAIGMIQTNTTLDREKHSMYVMIITATDLAKRDSRQGTCTVTVFVNDVNDNSPVFNTKYGYTGTITENSAYNDTIQVVPSIAVSDVDFGTNGTAGIRFSIQSQGNDSKYFSINKISGDIFVATEIDREKKKEFHLMILAEDSNGGQGARNNTRDLAITVIDENDSPPVFINAPYVFSVSENSPSSTSVGQVTVTDDDVNGTEHVRFRIIHGDNEKFYIETEKASGIIRVMGNIDRETKDIYNLTVTANDGENESNTTVTINILDMNDEAPVFVDKTLTVEVTENMPVGTFVCNVTATDGDQNNTNNSKVTYSLRNTTDFRITQNGEITTLQKFDREVHSRYEIEVKALDSGNPQLNATMSIIVLISDVNDNSPQFLDENGRNITQKEVNIVEKCPVDTVVALVFAQDDDIADNGEIVFSIEQQNTGDYFMLDQIDETTAVLRVAKAVVINTLTQNNRNTSDSKILDVTINARDNATVDNRRNSSMIIRVAVEPINDAMPVFLKPDKPLKIWENITVGSMVGQCQAIVKNASFTHLTYLLLDNRTKADFSLESENCTISTKVSMDRERTDMYNFPVMVKDGRTPERTAYTQIEIIVMDVNDNSPEFYQPVIRLDITENTDYLQPINVSAVDADMGENANLTYMLLDDFDGTFWIKHDTGILNISQKLDYEKHTNFTLTILATDNGDPSLSTTATVYLTVTDLNDNAPQFYNVNNTISIQENFVGKIYEVHANDSDSGLNGEIVYSLKSSSKDLFTIHPFDGSLYVSTGLDFETTSKHFLEITATDNGNPPKSSTINITVIVKDVYDFVPQFDKELYECTVSRSALARDVIIDMNVTHGNQNVTFGMKGTGLDFFTIDKETGEIYVAQSLDTQKTDYILMVTAEDKKHTKTAVCKVLVRVVDLLLVFPQKEYQVNVTENLDKVFLVDLNTTEEISGHDVMYKIIRTEPNATGLFDIDSVGRISSLKPLDRERVSQYVLYITAELRNKRSKRDTSQINNLDYSALTRLVVQVTDENDNPPMFPNTQKRWFGVPRDARAGYYVTQALQAIDLDINGIIKYKAFGGAMDMFDVQKGTGAVVVRRAIASASKISEFNLTILAYDPTDSTKNDSISIQIHVIEDNNRLKLVTSLPIEEFRRKQDGLVRNMSAILGVDVETEKIEAHKEFKNGSISVFLDRSDFYFHAINSTTGLPVSSTELQKLIEASRNSLNSLFHGFTPSVIVTVLQHDNSSMGIPEIALICVAVLIFLGGLVGILISLSALRSMEHMEKSEMKGKALGKDDFEMGTVRSQSSRASAMRPIAAINPAFVETEFNTSGVQSQTDNKQPPELEHESQEVRFEFNDEPIDQNLPEAEIREQDIAHLLARNTTSKDSGVGNTSYSSHEILHSGSSAGSDGNSRTSSVEQNDSSSNNSNMDAQQDPKLVNGPIMTSSPKNVQYRDVKVIPESSASKSGKQKKGGKMSDTKVGILKLTDTVGETETDDGIDENSIDDDHTFDDIAITDETSKDLTKGSVEIGTGISGSNKVPDVLVEHDEITSL